jgi:hypothetical protein
MDSTSNQSTQLTGNTQLAPFLASYDIERMRQMPTQQVMEHAASLGDLEILVEWRTGDVANQLASRGDQTVEQIASALRRDIPTLNALATTASQWAPADREPGVAPDVHALVFEEFVTPLGATAAVMGEARAILAGYAGKPQPASASIRAFLRSRRTEIAQTLQLELLSVPRDEKVKAPSAGRMADWEAKFMRLVGERWFIVEAAPAGERCSLYEVPLAAWTAMWRQARLVDTAIGWHPLAATVQQIAEPDEEEAS